MVGTPAPYLTPREAGTAAHAYNAGTVDGDRPQHVRSVDARLNLRLPNWVIAELERHSRERPGETLDGFLSDLVRQWAERRRAERVRENAGTLAGR